MARLKVLKTYKLYIGGAFPRTESGRFYQPINSEGNAIANMCLASRKDFRNSVVTARKAATGWSGKTAYNRSQVLYRIAEMLENNRAHFEAELISQGSTKPQSSKEVDVSIDRWVYYAGWCDKFTQVFGSINPVAGSYFNFSSLESTGVVTAICPENGALIGPTSVIAPIIASGNSVIVVSSKSKPLSSISLAEVINNSDVPGGVVNILTGDASELLSHIGVHMDVNAIWYLGNDPKAWKQIQLDSAENVKRVTNTNSSIDLMDSRWDSAYILKEFTEVKTTWHPIENVGASGSGY